MDVLKTILFNKVIIPLVGITLFNVFVGCQDSNQENLKNVTIVINDRDDSPERIAAQVLTEEVEKRSGFKWKISTDQPKEGHRIVLSAKDLASDDNIKPEGYSLKIEKEDGEVKLLISGTGSRGVLYGVGKLLRMLEWGKGKAELPNDMNISSAPVYPIRGHQLGYRATANSYDAWTPEIYDQYIRELALFGTNSIENIPLHPGQSPHLKFDPNEMNIKLSEICDKYDLDYWVWTPATFDLTNKDKREEAIQKHRAMYNACPRLDGIFFPGGDPGKNHPKLIMPFLEELSGHLIKEHPGTKIWFSLQGFDKDEIEYVFNYLELNEPDWFGGLVNGPGSPPIPDSRKRLPKKYKFRHYPDITHSCRSQYPVSWWDPALGRTLGRECPNPQPVYYSLIHNWFAPFTDGFITYSDGMHDDVNKIIWSARGWDPDVDIREVLKEYARFFFRPDLAELATDGILALENNWIGALVHNGAVESTLKNWQFMADKAPELDHNWRWQLCQLRSKYDAYIRRRVIYERGLEEQVYNALLTAREIGADSAISKSKIILKRAVSEPISVQLKKEIEDLGLALFNSIGFQTSVKKYQARSLNRGAIIDYLDLPMNNRYWLEDEFTKIQKFASEEKKLERLETIRNWEKPGEGSFYDDLGTLDRSSHLVLGEGLNTDPLMERNPNPGFWYWDEGFNRLRLSWLVSMDRPVAVVYENIDPAADYDVRVTGYRVDKIQINGEWVKPFIFSDEKGSIVEYHVPKRAVKSEKIVLNWGDPEITEVWLIKK